MFIFVYYKLKTGSLEAVMQHLWGLLRCLHSSKFVINLSMGVCNSCLSDLITVL